MNRHLGLAACFLGLTATHAAGEGPGSTSQSVSSPDGRIRVEVFLDPTAGAPSAVRYRVSFRGRPVVLPSRLGVDLADGSSLGAGSTIESVETRSFRETSPSSLASGAGASTTGRRP